MDIDNEYVLIPLHSLERFNRPNSFDVRQFLGDNYDIEYDKRITYILIYKSCSLFDHGQSPLGIATCAVEYGGRRVELRDMYVDDNNIKRGVVKQLTATLKSSGVQKVFSCCKIGSVYDKIFDALGFIQEAALKCHTNGGDDVHVYSKIFEKNVRLLARQQCYRPEITTTSNIKIVTDEKPTVEKIDVNVPGIFSSVLRYFTKKRVNKTVANDESANAGVVTATKVGLLMDAINYIHPSDANYHNETFNIHEMVWHNKDCVSLIHPNCYAGVVEHRRSGVEFRVSAIRLKSDGFYMPISDDWRGRLTMKDENASMHQTDDLYENWDIEDYGNLNDYRWKTDTEDYPIRTQTASFNGLEYYGGDVVNIRTGRNLPFYAARLVGDAGQP